MDTFRHWIQDQFTPVVLVAASPAAEAICVSKNGLGIVDMLRPFSQIPRLDVSLHVGEAVQRVTDIKLRFHAANTMYQPKAEAAEEYLKDVLQSAAQKYIKDEAAGPDLLKIVHSGRAPPAASPGELGPWFLEYRDDLMRLAGWGEHEALDHPVAALLVVPADASNPVSHFEALLNQVTLPPLMQQEVMYPLKDREFPKHYVLLLDGGAGIVDERRASENLAACMRAFGQAHCSLVKVNTGTGDRASQGATPDFFKKFMRPGMAGGGAGEPQARPPPPPQGLGAFLSVSDLDSVAGALREFAAKTLLPKLEERCAKLNAGITATRRGIRNQFKRFWKGGLSDDAAIDKPYPWHSIESQLRQLADLALLLHAYDFAAATYRLAAQDYLAANANRWYAGAQEMLGVAVLLSHDDDNDPFKYFSRALEHYAKLPPSRASRMLSTRCALLASAYLTAAGRFATASMVLMRAHFDEENARAALLLEQSAYCLLYCQPPAGRKFAFQCVLAGLRYHAAGQKKLAIHAYRQVLGAYTSKRWRAIEQHLHDVLGKQCWEGGDDGRAAQHFMALLQDCSAGQPAASQAHYLGMFMEAVKRMTLKDAKRCGPLPGLRLPTISLQDPQVTFAGAAYAGNPTAAALPDSAWTRLEACVSESAGAGASNWLEGGISAAGGGGGGGKQQTKDHEEYNTVVAGEQVVVGVRFTNPLAVKLRLSAVRLTVEFTPTGDVPTGGVALAAPIEPVAATPLTPSSPGDASEQGAADPHPLAAGGPASLGQRPKLEGVDVQDVRLALHPGESVVEGLRVTARAPGWLRVTGVAWVVNECVEGSAPFDVRGRKRKHPKGPRPGQLKHFPPSRRLLFSVLPAAPRLELVAEALPRALHSGEVARCVLAVRNVGGVACRNLQLVVGHPEAAATQNPLLIGPSGQVLAGSPPAAGATLQDLLWGGGESVAPSRIPTSAQGKGASLFRPPWPTTTGLPPGGRLEWPVWVHPRGAGTLRLQLLVYCEPVASAPVAAGHTALRYRTMRLAHAIQVAPLVAPKPSLGPAGLQDLGSQVLRLDMEAHKDGQAAAIMQLTTATRGGDAGWRLVGQTTTQGYSAPSSTPDAPQHTLQPGIVLQPGDTTAATYILQPPGSGSSGIGGVGAAGAVPAQVPAGAVDLLGAMAGSGPLGYWYGPPKRGLDSMPPSHAASSARLGQADQGAASNAAPGGLLAQAGGAGSGAAAMHADPPVDVFMVWQCAKKQDQQGAAVGEGVGPASACPTGAASCSVPSSERIGVTRLPDLTGTARPPLQPVRLALRVASSGTASASAGVVGAAGSGAASGAVVRHDFRHAPMCLIPLRLVARNCSGGDASITVEAGDSWQSPAAAHAWQIAAPAQAAAAAAAPAPPAYGTASTHSSRASSPERQGAGASTGGGTALQPLGRPSVARSQAGGAAPPALTFAAGLEPSTEYMWCGRTCANVARLAPGADVEVALQVAVFRPGTYAIAGCRVSYAVESAALSVSEIARVDQLLLRVDAA